MFIIIILYIYIYIYICIYTYPSGVVIFPLLLFIGVTLNNLWYE